MGLFEMTVDVKDEKTYATKKLLSSDNFFTLIV